MGPLGNLGDGGVCGGWLIGAVTELVGGDVGAIVNRPGLLNVTAAEGIEMVFRRCRSGPDDPEW